MKQARLSSNPSNAPSNVKAPQKNHKAQRHIIKSLINSYYYTYSNVLEICYMKQMTTIKHRLHFHNFTSGYIDSFDRNYILYILLYTKTLVHLRPFTCLPWKTVDIAICQSKALFKGWGRLALNFNFM